MKKRVLGWGVWSQKDSDFADIFFKTKKEAKKYYDIVWNETVIKFPNLPLSRLAVIKKNYQVVKVEIKKL